METEKHPNKRETSFAAHVASRGHNRWVTGLRFSLKLFWFTTFSNTRIAQQSRSVYWVSWDGSTRVSSSHATPAPKETKTPNIGSLWFSRFHKVLSPCCVCCLLLLACFRWTGIVDKRRRLQFHSFSPLTKNSKWNLQTFVLGRRSGTCFSLFQRVYRESRSFGSLDDEFVCEWIFCWSFGELSWSCAETSLKLPANWRIFLFFLPPPTSNFLGLKMC